ncbi:MAG: TraR/DksA C4-type zinc finger protein [Halanaerobiales bacterium]
MTTKDFYQKKLREIKNSLENRLKKFKDEERISQKNSTGELSSYDNHPGDQGSETYEREKDLGLKNNTANQLKQVNIALNKLRKGKYGYCNVCGQKIDKQRLRVIPYSDICRICSKKNSKENLINRKADLKNTEFNIETDPVNIKGMGEQNAWEEVARYGNSNSGQDLKSPEDK